MRSLRTAEIPAYRGLIADRRGEPLAVPSSPYAAAKMAASAYARMFHALYGLRDCVYEIPDLDCLVFLDRDRDRVRLFDVVAERVPPLEALYPYLAPEAILGERDSGRGPGPPADLYAVGCVAYWLLTGRYAYRARSLDDLERALEQRFREALPPGAERFEFGRQRQTDVAETDHADA